MKYFLAMPAAGTGRRFGGALPKQYAPLRGRTVIEWALAPFVRDARCELIVVVLAAGERHWNPTAVTSKVTRAEGGAERSHSVRSGLAALASRAQPSDWVLVHDAVRPCLAPADLERLLRHLGGHPLGGLLATPAADTLKRADGSGQIETTVERAGLWRALTPQMFRYGRLCEALDRAHAAGRRPTDEAQAIEWLGERPQLVEGSSTNLKITTAADLTIAAALLAEYSCE